MDITKVNDLKLLKALAYDTLQAVEVQQSNLRLIQQRIVELQQEPVESEPVESQPAAKKPEVKKK